LVEEKKGPLGPKEKFSLVTGRSRQGLGRRDITKRKDDDDDDKEKKVVWFERVKKRRESAT
jgi:hypothetical protein